MAVVEHRQDSQGVELISLRQGQQVLRDELEHRFDQHGESLAALHEIVKKVASQVDTFPKNGTLAGLKRLGAHADKLVEYMEHQTPEQAQMGEYIRQHGATMYELVKAAGPLVDLINSRRDRIIFWTVIRRWVHWDGFLKKALYAIAIGAMTTLAAAEVVRLMGIAGP